MERPTQAPAKSTDDWGVQTAMAHLGDERNLYHGAVVTPIFESSLFTFPSYEAAEIAFTSRDGHFIYTRGNNPTVLPVEQKIAFLERAPQAKLFGSGMAAISSAINHCIKAGSHVICVKSCYPVTYNYLTQYLTKFGVETTFVVGDAEEIRAAIRPNTDLIYLESPSSMVFNVLDVPAITKVARENGITTILDNSWASPVFQQPIQLGVDIVVHSASKYLCGHSDVVAGALISSDAVCKDIDAFERAMGGGIIGPFEAWLIMRGLRTIELRMQRHQENALCIASYLDNHPKIRTVNYPGLPTSPYHQLARQQMSGFSGLFSFQLDTDVQGVRTFLNALRLFKIGVSWGGFESLAYAPVISLAKEMPEDAWSEAGITPTLVRVSIGLENAHDLLADLDNALALL